MMPHGLGEGLAVALLAGVLAAATARPRRLPEVAVAVPAAVLLVVIGALPASSAAAELRDLGPTVGFLLAVLVLGHLCDAEGVFQYAGRVAARACRGQPVRLLALVVVLAAVVTAVLSLDATVVLLTPVVFATASAVRVRARPHVYACTHLANAGSLLLPVSNLTNLLAFGASGVSFVHFGVLMVLPWCVVVAVECAGLRLFFARGSAYAGRPGGRTGGGGAARRTGVRAVCRGRDVGRVCRVVGARAESGLGRRRRRGRAGRPPDGPPPDVGA
jgi:arsenical pump membrane protein